MMQGFVFKNVISLGHFCSPALEIERFGFRNASYPFDWCLTDDFSGVLDLIENGFKDLFKIELFVQWTSQLQVYDNERYNMTFVHDFNEIDSLDHQIYEVEKKYDRRIKKLYDAIDSRTLFIRYIKDELEIDYIKKNVERIRKILHLNDNNIVFVVNDDIYKKAKDLLQLGFILYSVKKDENDVVARTFFDQLDTLVEYIINHYDPSLRASNLEFFRAKLKKQRAVTTKKRLLKLYSFVFHKRYVHSRQVEKYDARHAGEKTKAN